MRSGLAITLGAVSGLGTRHGTTAATDSMSLGTTAIGIITIPHGTTAGTIHGTTDGMTHTIAHGDGLTTDTIAGTRLTGTEDTTTHTIMVEVVVAAITTDVLAMRVR